MSNEQFDRLKKRLGKGKKSVTLTSDGWIPAVVGEYMHDDIEWLLNRVEELESENADLREELSGGANW